MELPGIEVTPLSHTQCAIEIDGRRFTVDFATLKQINENGYTRDVLHELVPQGSPSHSDGVMWW